MPGSLQSVRRITLRGRGDCGAQGDLAGPASWVCVMAGPASPISPTSFPTGLLATTCRGCTCTAEKANRASGAVARSNGWSCAAAAASGVGDANCEASRSSVRGGGRQPAAGALLRPPHSPTIPSLSPPGSSPPPPTAPSTAPVSPTSPAATIAALVVELCSGSTPLSDDVARASQASSPRKGTPATTPS